MSNELNLDERIDLNNIFTTLEKWSNTSPYYYSFISPNSHWLIVMKLDEDGISELKYPSDYGFYKHTIMTSYWIRDHFALHDLVVHSHGPSFGSIKRQNPEYFI